jgi:hypothetical protein
MELSKELQEAKKRIYQNIEDNALLYNLTLSRTNYPNTKKIIDDYLKQSNYVEKGDYLVKDFVYIKTNTNGTFIIGHDIPGNKGYLCKIGVLNGFQRLIKYFERI